MSQINWNSKPKMKTTPTTSSISFGSHKADNIDSTETKNIESKIKAEIMFNINQSNKSVNHNIFVNTEDKELMGHVEAFIKEHPTYKSESNRLKNLSKELLKNDLLIISSWGEEAVTFQKNLISKATNTIKEFNNLDGTRLLEDVMNFKKNSSHSFFGRFTGQNYESYNLKLTNLKTELNLILPALFDYKNQITLSILPIYLSALIIVNDNYKSDQIISDALYNRRLLLNGAAKNIEMLKNQIDQTITLILDMQTQMNHIIDVVLPAMKLKG